MNPKIKIHINLKKNNVHYLIIVLLASIFPLISYPQIYGIDGFQIIWMAEAIRNGALFSENTWLISPFSYFGYYPFSFRGIGVPIFLALLINLLHILSFGLFGLPEAILVYNIILIIILYKCVRTLGNTLFEEEWSKFIFVAAVLFAPLVFYETMMMASTRIVIIIIIIIFLNLHLKILDNSIKKSKATLFMLLLLLVGALAHRLWISILLSIFFMIFTIFIRRFKNLQKLSVFLILPITTIAFFLGFQLLETFSNYSRLSFHNLSSFLDYNDLFGKIVLLVMYYGYNSGFILIFFPIGVIITIYKVSLPFKNCNKTDDILNKTQQKYYLLLFIIPLSFLFSVYTYLLFIFLPILIIFSIYGIIFVKKFISTHLKKSIWIIPLILLLPSLAYQLIRETTLTINSLYYMFLLSLILFIFLLFIIISYYKNQNFSKTFYKTLKHWTIATTIIIILSSALVAGSKKNDYSESPYPWENGYLTNQEIEIIEYLKNQEIDGLIFSTAGKAGSRIGYAGFFPIFSNNRSFISIGNALFYGLVSPNEVFENTKSFFSFETFSLKDLFKQRFFIYKPEDTYWESFPFEVLRRNIIDLNMTFQGDRFLLRSVFNVKYIISINKTFLPDTQTQIPLIQSLQQSEILRPVFSTQHLLVWKI